MGLKELYHRWKYRPAKGKDGATSIGFFSGNRESTFAARMAEYAQKISPCYKSNREVLTYIREKYGLESLPLSETERNMYKVNFILNHCPEVLKTPEIQLSEHPSRAEFLTFSEHNDKRFAEAMQYPAEDLGLLPEAYTFSLPLSADFSVPVQVIAENKTDRLSVSASVVGRTMSEEESRQLNSALDDITLFQGVTREDIDNRTARFQTYVAACIRAEEKPGGLL